VINIKLEKAKVRTKLLKIRQNLTPFKVDNFSAAITSRMLRQKKYKGFKNYLIYLPINNEVDTRLLIHSLRENNRNIFVPAYFKNKWVVSNMTALDSLELNKYKTLQPKSVQPTDINSIDLAFVPGVGFGKNGARLGFGKGVYDKLLINFKGLMIGLAYDFQIIDHMPSEPHDLKMDLIVNEKRIVDLRII